MKHYKFAVYVLTGTSTRKPASKDQPQRTYRLVDLVECENPATAVLFARQSPKNVHLLRGTVSTMGAVVWTGQGTPPHEVVTTGPHTLESTVKERAKYSKP